MWTTAVSGGMFFKLNHKSGKVETRNAVFQIPTVMLELQPYIFWRSEHLSTKFENIKFISGHSYKFI